MADMASSLALVGVGGTTLESVSIEGRIRPCHMATSRLRAGSSQGWLPFAVVRYAGLCGGNRLLQNQLPPRLPLIDGWVPGSRGSGSGLSRTYLLT